MSYVQRFLVLRFCRMKFRGVRVNLADSEMRITANNPELKKKRKKC